MLEIEAVVFSSESDEFCDTLGFANSPSGDDKYLIIQTKDVFDQFEIDSGHDMPYFEFGNPFLALYGCLGSIDCDANAQTITFHFTPASKIQNIKVRLFDVPLAQVLGAINDNAILSKYING